MTELQDGRAARQQLIFDENKMKLKSKRINDEHVRIPLTPVQILHFKLLYYIVYTKKKYPNKEF